MLQRLLINWCQSPKAFSIFHVSNNDLHVASSPERCHLFSDQPVTDTALLETQERLRLQMWPVSSHWGPHHTALIIPASITHHNVTNHSLSRHWRPLIGHSTQLRASHWSIFHIAGLPFADLLHRWSVSQDEKLSHHLQSSSHTHAPQFVV